MKVSRITVLGAGVMGHCIAQVAAQAGFEVYLRDIKEDFLNRGMESIRKSLNKLVSKGKISEEEARKALERIKPTLDLKEAVGKADLIIEAVPEDVNIKKEVFKEVDFLAPGHAIIASNTSSISITELASVTSRPEKVCGMHFFNPPQLMKLVEVIRGAKTSDETVEVVVEIARKMGKEPVVIKKDSPGFIVNRILFAALNEAAQLVYEGVASVEDVDKAVKLGLNWPMGPFALMDLIGVDTTLQILNVLHSELGERYRPSALIKEKVRAKLLGRKSGEGFYKY